LGHHSLGPPKARAKATHFLTAESSSTP